MVSTTLVINAETSRIEAKRERDVLLKEGCCKFWDELVEAIESVIERLNEKYWDCKLERKSYNPSIELIEAPDAHKPFRTAEGRTGTSPVPRKMQISFSSSARAATTKHNDKAEIVWPIKADLAEKKLYFMAAGIHSEIKRLTPLQLAELLIPEDLLGMKLDE
jgi:hypothetical protein